jgi:hypothetical protein
VIVEFIKGEMRILLDSIMFLGQVPLSQCYDHCMCDLAFPIEYAVLGANSCIAIPLSSGDMQAISNTLVFLNSWA